MTGNKIEEIELVGHQAEEDYNEDRVNGRIRQLADAVADALREQQKQIKELQDEVKTLRFVG